MDVEGLVRRRIMVMMMVVPVMVMIVSVMIVVMFQQFPFRNGIVVARPCVGTGFEFIISQQAMIELTSEFSFV